MFLVDIEDLPELLELQREAYAPDFAGLGWTDDSPLEETLEHLREEYRRCNIYKVLDPEGRIAGSIRGAVSGGSLWIGRLMVSPSCQRQGIGRFLFRELQRHLPHHRAWLWACLQMPHTYDFYLREGFVPVETLVENPKLTWVRMEKAGGSVA